MHSEGEGSHPQWSVDHGIIGITQAKPSRSQVGVATEQHLWNLSLS